jgi:hypothetical protein
VAKKGKTRDGKDQAAIAERRRKALEFRKAGMGYEDIAHQMGLAGPGSAHRIVKKALRATYQEPADDVRKLELERLDRLMLAWWPAAIGRGKTADGKPAVPPDGDATDRVLKIIKQRTELLGLDARTAILAARNPAPPEAEQSLVDPETARRVLGATTLGEGPQDENSG